ncbi:hypothetical protein ACQKP1_02460 [Allorhizobium sp. NPDC080224]|uniref:hypothetical protein n=1 Tax=Allorhizobium sp. NPDC080224 TaxID=3390547 RepID=UPI003D0367FB
MTKRQLPPEIRAENLTIGRTTFAYRHARHFDNINVEAGKTVSIATQAANESAAFAIQHLKWVGGQSRWVFDMQMALGAILQLSDRHRETWELPDTRLTHELMGAVYSALGSAIRWGTSEPGMGKMEIEHLTEGLLAAARLVEAIDKEQFTDRHNDDRSRVKILIHRARIAEHYQDLARWRRDRERGTIDQILGKAAEEADIFS